MQFGRVLVPIAITLALAATAIPATAAGQSERRVLEQVTITTVGWGHGKGLSQYGARNRAEAGQRWKQIVRNYYPHTKWGTASGKIRIQITADTSRDVVVLPRSGLKARSLGAKRTWKLPAKIRGEKVPAWKIRPAGRHPSEIAFRTGSWQTWRRAKGDAQFMAGGRPIVLKTPAGRASYRGALRSVSMNASGRDRDTVNVLPLDAYLRGVVPREVPASWPKHAVRAQAVAARTYAAFERRDHRRAQRRAPYDLCDTSACQVYGGYDAEHPLSTAAIRATAGKIVRYRGHPIFAQFSASNGGWSLDGGYPYLRAAEDPYDRGAAGDPTVTTFRADQITRAWPEIGDLVAMEVTAADGRGALDGRVTEVTITGADATVTATGQQLRDWLGLRSTIFRIS